MIKKYPSNWEQVQKDLKATMPDFYKELELARKHDKELKLKLKRKKNK